MGVKIGDGEDLNLINVGFRLSEKGEKVEMAVAIPVGNLGMVQGVSKQHHGRGEKVKVHFPKDLEKVKVKGGRARNPGEKVVKVLQVKVVSEKVLGTREHVSTVAKLDIKRQNA